MSRIKLENRMKWNEMECSSSSNRIGGGLTTLHLPQIHPKLSAGW